MAEDYESKRAIMCEMLKWIFDCSQLFGRKVGMNHAEYMGWINDVPFQCEPRSQATYYLFRINGLYIDCVVNNRCVIRLSSTREVFHFTFTPTDDHTHVSFELLWRLIHLMIEVNKYIDVYGRVQVIDPDFSLQDVKKLNEWFSKI